MIKCGLEGKFVWLMSAWQSHSHPDGIQAKSFVSPNIVCLVKDRGMMGQGMFLGEAFIPLQEIQVLYSDTQNIVE